jgi:4-amino-4-deoxy-L-arabinose transferase-like glycosyltransferase
LSDLQCWPTLEHDGSRPAHRRVAGLLFGVVGAVAFVVRAAYAFDARAALFYGSDNTWYVTVARSIADGHSGRIPGVLEPSVLSLRFPPAYPTTLALGQSPLFWVKPIDADRWISVALGAAAAVVVTWLLWRLTRDTKLQTRVIASSVGGLVYAVNPIVAGASAGLMSEPLAMVVIALTLVQVDRMLVRREPARLTDGLLLGGLLAVGILTRVEGILYVAAPVVSAILLTRSTPRTARTWGVALGIGLVAFVGWSAFASAVAGSPVALTTNGSPMNGANCRASQYGDGAGFWTGACAGVDEEELSPEAERALATRPVSPFTLAPAVGPEIEAEVSRAQTKQGFVRVADRPLDFLRAVPFRLARVTGVYWTDTQTRLEYFEGRDEGWEKVGRVFHLIVVLPLTLVGIAAFLFRRSRLRRRLERITDPRRLIPALSMLPVWMLLTIVTYGSARLRAPVEPVLAVLVGIAVVVLLPTPHGSSEQ